MKFLLDQLLSAIPQHQWFNKLFGFNFMMEYRPGQLNSMADALSCRDSDSADEPAHLQALLGMTFAFLDKLWTSMASNA